MTKRIIVLALIALFFAGTVYAANPYPDYRNVELAQPTGADITKPVMRVVLVRNAKCHPAGGGGLNDDTKILSGDVLVYDLNSADGISISRCIADMDSTFAGVAVTDILTSDASTMVRSDKSWGYMCVGGYCLAKVDTTTAVAGDGLVANGATLVSSFITKIDGNISNDRGVLLSLGGGTDQAERVMLRYAQ